MITTDEQLSRRFRDALAAAQQMLELEPATADAGDEGAWLRKLITLAGERLSGAGGSVATGEHDAALERLRQRFEGRFEALARAQAAVAELREISSPATMLAQAPAALCRGSTLRRAILSVVRDATMIA